MKKLFDPDSSIMLVLTELCNLVILNLVYLVCCLPVLTIGPASAALHTVAFSMQKNGENSVLRPFFRAFRQNFRQAFFFGLAYLALFAILIYDGDVLNYYGVSPIFLAPLFVLVLFPCSHTFALVAMYDNTFRGTLINSFVLSFRCAPRTILIVLLQLAPLIFLVCAPVLFFQTALIWIVIGLSALCYVCCLLLRKNFRACFGKDPCVRELPPHT